MTTELKRYSLIHDPEYQSQMLQRHDGKYVRFADVQGVIKSAIAIKTTDPAAIREAALREAANALSELADNALTALAYEHAQVCREVVLDLIGEKK